jgi:hypothetical protein
MLNCRRATRLVSDRLDRSLSWFNRLRLGVHLLACPPCARFRRAVEWLHRSLASAPFDDRLSPQARARIQRALDEAAGT